jgi:hypothetical protein
MPSGTTINGVEANRIHRCNAEEKLAEAEEVIRETDNWLMVLVGKKTQYPIDETVELLEDKMTFYRDAVMDRFLASYIIDYPDDCVDDYDPIKKDDDDEITSKVQQPIDP